MVRKNSLDPMQLENHLDYFNKHPLLTMTRVLLEPLYTTRMVSALCATNRAERIIEAMALEGSKLATMGWAVYSLAPYFSN